MKPRATMTAKARKKKVEWLHKLRMTTHSPDEGKMFPNSWRMFSTETAAQVKERVTSFKAAAAAKRSDLVFRNVTDVKSYLTKRGVLSLLCTV